MSHQAAACICFWRCKLEIACLLVAHHLYCSIVIGCSCDVVPYIAFWKASSFFNTLIQRVLLMSQKDPTESVADAFGGFESPRRRYTLSSYDGNYSRSSLDRDDASSPANAAGGGGGVATTIGTGATAGTGGSGSGGSRGSMIGSHGRQLNVDAKYAAERAGIDRVESSPHARGGWLSDRGHARQHSSSTWPGSPSAASTMSAPAAPTSLRSPQSRRAVAPSLVASE